MSKNPTEANPEQANLLITGREALKIIEMLGPDDAIAQRLQKRLIEGSTPLANAFRAAAHAHHHEDGEIEVDDNAVVSDSHEGAYVSAWEWVGWDEIPKEHWPSDVRAEEV